MILLYSQLKAQKLNNLQIQFIFIINFILLNYSKNKTLFEVNVATPTIGFFVSIKSWLFSTILIVLFGTTF